MLADIERKVLWILSNCWSARSRLPSVYELTIKTGRNRGGIFEVLTTLHREGYIVWTAARPEEITLLKSPWRREEEPQPMIYGVNAYGKR
jgi:DNA-binding transcriptional MocR family regulator